MKCTGILACFVLSKYLRNVVLDQGRVRGSKWRVTGQDNSPISLCVVRDRVAPKTCHVVYLSLSEGLAIHVCECTHSLEWNGNRFYHVYYVSTLLRFHLIFSSVWLARAGMGLVRASSISAQCDYPLNSNMRTGGPKMWFSPEVHLTRFRTLGNFRTCQFSCQDRILRSILT